MPCKFLLAKALGSVPLTLLFLFAVSAYAVEINYHYNGNHGVDFGGLKAGALALGKFTDARSVGDPREIADGVQAEAPLTDIVRTAFEQAFVAGNAQLAANNSQLVFDGELLEVAVEHEGESIKLTLRVHAMLKNPAANKTLWQNKLFGRVSVPQQEGIDGAMRAALDRLIEELMFDDYFLNEVLD